MDLRQNALKNWLDGQSILSSYQMHAIPGDASFRRYFRIQTDQRSYIAMDAPPPRENCVPFVAIADALRQKNIYAPEIFASDLEQGFLLLSDFGDQLYLKILNHHNAETLYCHALDTLATLQTIRNVNPLTLQPFTAEFMRNELTLFQEWFLQKHLAMNPETSLDICFDFLAQTAAEQPQVFMHRDYHSANLMLLPESKVGVLDFQDAFIGPVTYDLVSLLRDCYIAWPDELVKKLVRYYFQQLALLTISEKEFFRWFDLMGIQRHLKALLTFSRKYRRDNNANYLQHIPRTVDYIVKISAHYPECHVLHELMLVIAKKVDVLCEQ